jgi:hypothetical protein
MLPEEPIFVIPTRRLKDVAQTIERYDENFWTNGHATKLMIFDDSSLANHDKYYPLLEQTSTHNELFYVGPRQKEQFFAFLNQRVRDRNLESLIRNLFRPSYGGNRNFTLMYTLGRLMVSSDDDMRPDALIEHSVESLSPREICRGKLVSRGGNAYSQKSYDLLTAFQDVLGRKVKEIPDNYETGELVVDTAMDLETNTTKGFVPENSLFLEEGAVSGNAVVKIAQTFRTGTNDIDAIDFVHIYLNNKTQQHLDDLNEAYVLVNFRPVVTNKSWRMDCGVAGYDNRLGLPPFFPTRLRFEDYIYRLWIQQNGIVAAHVDAAQTHAKSNYMRDPLASEIFNEEISNLLKRKIKESISRLDDLTIEFTYDGEVTLQDSEHILERIIILHGQVVSAAAVTTDATRKQALGLFAEDLSTAFYGFEPDFFQQNVTRIVGDEVSQFHAALKLWPRLVEICYFRKDKKDLPQLRIRNQRK